MAARVSKADFDDKVLGSSLPVLVDFYSDSCVPCKRMSPVVGDVEDEREGSLSVYKVNINFDTELAEQYDVQSVPTLLLFKGGAEVARQSGAVRKDALNGCIYENVKLTYELLSLLGMLSALHFSAQIKQNIKPQRQK